MRTAKPKPRVGPPPPKGTSSFVSRDKASRSSRGESWPSTSPRTGPSSIPTEPASTAWRVGKRRAWPRSQESRSSRFADEVLGLRAPSVDGSRHAVEHQVDLHLAPTVLGQAIDLLNFRAAGGQ